MTVLVWCQSMVLRLGQRGALSHVAEHGTVVFDELDESIHCDDGSLTAIIYLSSLAVFVAMLAECRWCVLALCGNPQHCHHETRSTPVRAWANQIN